MMRRTTLPLLTLLSVWLLAACSLLPGHSSKSAADAATTADAGEDTPKPVIDPDIARRAVKVPRIRATNIEVGTFAGVLSSQELESAPVYGLRVAYHLSEDFFFEAEYARSTVSDTVRREIGQPFFPQETIPLTTYGIDVGYNVLPGEVFWGRKHAWSSALYLIGGAGNTSFDNEDYMTYSAGFGLKVQPLNRLSIRLEGRDRIWRSDLLGKPELTNNLETTLGIAVYF